MSRARTIEHINTFDDIASVFDVINKIGQGTFGTVFSVRPKFDPNSPIFALKVMVPTTGLRRIENELRILRVLDGQNGVIKLISAKRIRDYVFILTPYIRCKSFSRYYLTYDEKEIKRYLTSLLKALEHVHRHRIIHRDVKPSNFLLDQCTQQYTLVDFGLAHSQEAGDVDRNWTPTPMPLFNPKRQFSFVSTNSSKHKLTRSLVDDEYHLVRRFWDGTGSGDRLVLRPSSQANISNSPTISESSKPVCVCGNRLTVCRPCLNYRKGPTARRGGTLGYRPPEVIYNTANQTTAVDIWAVGVIFCSFLTGHYPFITGDSDFEAIHTFTHLLSFERMQKGAQAVGKNLYLKPKPPPLAGQKDYIYLKDRLERIRREMKEPPPLPPTFCSDAPPSRPAVALPRNYKFEVMTFDLCSRLLEPNPRLRISASKALAHPYLAVSN
nr:CDC7 cell division cycle 7 [Hymenolepis microstoma]